MFRIALIGMVIWLAGALQGAHAQRSAHVSCQDKALPATISEARTALDRQPRDLGPRVRLADALVDQGCYAEALTVLEEGEPLHPHSVELTGKLRAVRSLLTEQTYIQDLTQAEDVAKLQHDQLRCTKIGDLESCNQALRQKPDDLTLQLAQADALLQAGRPGEAAQVYQRAAEREPGNESVRSRLAVARTRQSAAASTQGESHAAVASPAIPSPAIAGPALTTGASAAKSTADGRRKASRAASTARTTRAGTPERVATASAPVPLIESDLTPSYSNEAPAGSTN